MSYKTYRRRHLAFLRGEARERAIEWLEDDAWVTQREYGRDREYMACVQDIMETPVFRSMASFAMAARASS